MLATKPAISTETLREGTHQLEIVDFPRISGIYFLMLRGRVVYVGKSTDVYQRVFWHRRNYVTKSRDSDNGISHSVHKPGYEFDEARFVEVAADDLDEYEQRAIAQFCPPCNSLRSVQECRLRYPQGLSAGTSSETRLNS